jgi:hypothetical protein
MDDQLDNELKKRIAEVFENYEDTDANEGWLMLREKYPEKAKRRVAAWIWWAPAAALLLLFLGILWFKTTPKQQQVTIAKTQAGHLPVKKAEGKKNNKITLDSNALQQNNQGIAQNAQKHDTAPRNIERKLNPVTRPDKEQKEIALNHQKNINPGISKNPVNTTQTHNIAQAKIETQGTPAEKTELAATAKPTNTPLLPSNPKNEIIAQVDSGVKSSAKSNAVVTKPEVNMLAQQVNKPGKQSFADDNLGYKKQSTLSRNKTVNFAVYTTTYVNYAKGSSHQFNVGGGFTSDIQLTKNLQFSTGLSIGQNSLSYGGTPPAESTPEIASFTNAATPSDFGTARYTFVGNNSPSFKNYSANLVGLDIPLNLKFILDPKKSTTYLLAGVSSGTYINETYTYSYSNPSLFSANISQVQNQSTRNSFNGFYFAKTLNLAFGTGYMVGHTRLIVEPFLKYPLEGLGSQQLRFGSSGINLKFNFNGFKK